MIVTVLPFWCRFALYKGGQEEWIMGMKTVKFKLFKKQSLVIGWAILFLISHIGFPKYLSVWCSCVTWYWVGVSRSRNSFLSNSLFGLIEVLMSGMSESKQTNTIREPSLNQIRNTYAGWEVIIIWSSTTFRWEICTP